jgi:ABC-2 type transport system ATP-binding protein
VISINGMIRNYDKLLALGRLNLEVPSGELFGFIDLNGRGKTTTIKLLVALIKPSSGTIHIDDVDIKQDCIRVKKIIGYIPDRPFIDNKLIGWE